MKRQQICRAGMSVVLALAFGWGCGVASGAEVGLALAERAALAWARGGGGFGTLGGAGDEGVSGKTWQESGTGGKVHVVRVGGGYVVTTADDGLEPIVAWGEGEPEWLEEEGHPFRTLLAADLAMRAGGEKKVGGPVRRDIRATEQARSQWAALLGEEDGTRAAANGTRWVSEIRHDAMLETKWNQQKNNYGNYRYNLYLPYTETVRLGRGAGTRGTVLDQQGDWQLRQTEEGAVKTLWLEKKRGGRAVELAQVEVATAMVTNTWWDEWAGGAKGGGAWVTEVETVGGEYEFSGFVNAGRAYWEDEENGMARLWTTECAHPEERMLLAEGPMGDETVGGKAAFGARRWRRGVAWTEEEKTFGWEGGEMRRLGWTKRGGARGEYEGSGSGQYDPTGSGGYEPVPSGGGSGGGGGGSTNYHIIYTVTKRRVPAGCVATAGGQLMYWWKAPSGKVQQVRRTCTVFGKSTNMLTKSGTYNWAGMGGVEPRTAAEGYAVSKLLYDIAVACSADFEQDGTSMSAYNFVSSLTGVFGYAGARWTQFGSSYNAAALQRAVIPNLDAGAPVMLGIQNPTTGAGHEVVVDGCGTDGGAFAVHLNLGWGGSGTMWYKPPQIYPNSSQNYNVLSDVAYNISPTWNGEILSGRVLGPHGRVVGGASVTVRNASGTTVYSGTAGMNGIYAWRWASSGSYTIRVSVGGVSAESSASVAASTGSAVGNGMCDVTLSGVQTVGPVTWSMSAARGTSIGQATAVTLSCGTAGAEIRYTLDGSEPTAESALYEGPIVVQGTSTLKAAAFAAGMERSPTAAEELTFVDEDNPDNFASARELFGAEGNAGFSNAGYGKESGEPIHSSDGYQGGASAWAKWTAPRNGRWAFALSGTTADGEELDTQLAIYTGTEVGALAPVAANDDSGGTYSSRTSFNAKKGTVYRIAMDTYQGEAGQMTLEWGTNGVETAAFSQYGQFMPVGGGTFTATVTSSAPWTLPDVCDWVEAWPGSGKSGDAVTFSVQENDDDAGRTGYVYVLAGEDESSEMGRLVVCQTALDFVTNRATAVARAQAEGKRILLVWGREGCGNTWATMMSTLAISGPKERLEAGYVLWYSNCDRQSDGDAFASWGTLPTVAVIDPADMSHTVAATNGYRTTLELAALMGNVVVFRSEEENRNVEVRYPASGTALGALPTAVRAGYVFDGWWTNPTGGTRVTTGTVPGDGVTVYYAHWIDKQVTTFKGNGGTPATLKTTNTVGKTYGTFPTVTWTNHVFLGWYTATNGGTRVLARYDVTEEATRTLYARWTDKQTTFFKGNGGTPTEQVRTNTMGKAYGTFPNETWANHAFLGWFTAATGGTRVYTNSSVTVAKDRTLYAHWTTNQVTTFKGNGGTPATLKTTNTIGKTYGTFPAVTWTNHVLLGWYTASNGGTRVLGHYNVTEEATRTLWAHWTNKQRTVFQGNGGMPTEQVRTNMIGKTYGTFPAVTWANHAFLGWYTATNGGTRILTNSTVTVAKDRTLYAHWTTNQVTTFKGNGGKPTTLKTTNTIGKTYGTFPTVTWSNHVFLGWYTATNGGTRVLGHHNVTEEATRTLYARWTDKQTTFFKGNGGTPTEQVRTNTMGKAYGTFPNVTWANHAFLGWYTTAAGGTRITTNSTVTVAKDRTLYAHWMTNQVTTFKGNGGTPATLKTTNTIGKTYGTFPTVTWSNHVFLGWYTATNGGTRVLTRYDVTAEATRTLYARWTDKQTTIFKGNGGTPGEQVRTNTMGKAYGVLPDATWANHAFLGWYTVASGGTRIATNSTVTVAKERTLYAHWTTNQVTTFKGNGGTPATLKTTNTIGKTYGTFPAVTWSNHVFLGWYTATNGGTRVLTRYNVTEESTRTLYARWTDKQATVFQGNGGTPAEQVRTNTMGKVYGVLPDVTWANHAFLGWYTTAAGGTRIATNSTVTVAKDRTLYAHWTTNQVTTFKGNGGTPATLKTTNTIGKTYGTFPTVTWTNHVLLGWYTATNGGTRVLTRYDVTAEATRTLYARWTDKQTVTFQGNGGTPAEQVRTNTMGKAYGTFPDVTWANHSFLGWFTAAEGGTRILTNSTVTVAKERTLWAHWREGAKSLSILGMCMEPRYSMARMAGRSNAEVVVLRFEAEAGGIYEVQWTEKLGGEWETILSWQAEADGVVELEVPMRAGEAGAGFYRVATDD